MLFVVIMVTKTILA